MDTEYQESATCPHCGSTRQPTPEPSEADWQAAEEHFRTVRQQYLDLPAASSGPALMLTFAPIARRFASGERTRELYEEMTGVG